MHIYNCIRLQGELKFEAGEVAKGIEVSIIDDDCQEPDVTFSVVLSDVQGEAVLIQVTADLI